MELPTIFVLLGTLLLLLGIAGGGFKIKEITMPKVGRMSRLFASVLGAIFIILGLAVYLDIVGPNKPINLFPHKSDSVNLSDIDSSKDLTVSEDYKGALPDHKSDTVKLRDKNSSKYLAVAEADKSDGGNVIIWYNAGQGDIVWYLELQGENRYKIKNCNSDKYLAVDGSIIENGRNIIQWQDNDQAGITWELKREDGDSECYKIRSFGSNKYLAVSSSATQDGANVILWQDDDQLGIVWCLDR